MEQPSFERFCNFDALYDASYKICRNVRWKDSVINLEEHRIETILKTEEDLRACEYKHQLFSCFSIIERGKPRDIRACHINDRLVQNALSEQVLVPELTPRFIYDNCATLKDKGTDFALSRLKQHLQQAHKEYGLKQDFFALRIDIRKYFDSIDHATLKQLVKKLNIDKPTYNLCCQLIDTFTYSKTKDTEPQPNKIYYVASNDQYQPLPHLKRFKPKHTYYEYSEKSLGLGSQVSQLLALLALDPVDHYIKEQLHIKYYGRYMDDLYLLHNDSKYLSYCLQQIKQQLQLLGLSINPKKTVISRIKPLLPKEPVHGTPLKYLKWNFYVTTTNHVIQLPVKKKITQQKHRLRKMKALLAQGLITEEDIATSYQCWRAHINKGNSFHIIQNMDNYFKTLFPTLKVASS